MTPEITFINGIPINRQQAEQALAALKAPKFQPGDAVRASGLAKIYLITGGLLEERTAQVDGPVPEDYIRVTDGTATMKFLESRLNLVEE